MAGVKGDVCATGLATELASYASAYSHLGNQPRGRRVLRELFECCPSLEKLVSSAGIDTVRLLGGSGATWTETELRELSELYWEGRTLDEIAERMGRSRGAVAHRLRVVGATGGNRRRP